MALDPSVVDSVVNTNFKTMAEQAAFATNQQMQLATRAMEDSIQDQRDSRLLSKSVLGSLCKRIVETDIAEAVANAKNATADLPNREVELGAATALSEALQVALTSIAQVLVKAAQTTPPETGSVGATIAK
jgi:hypothetical protein